MPIGAKGDEAMRVELYKIINGELRLVDYGVLAKMEEYAAQGYVAIKEK